jgi:ATP-binding protein involved in chromosome partitioning
MAISELIIQSTLKLCIDPNTGKDFVSAKLIKNIQINGNDVSLDVVLGYPALSQLAPIRQQVTDALKSIDGIAKITVNVGSRIVAHGVQRGVNLLPNVKNVIAVASGKGGVGKSTTSVNLALALAAEGATVGLLDADIYGPSQPQMLGISGRPDSADGKSIEPMRAHGIQAMSIGFLVDTDTPMVWRGPMVTGALTGAIIVTTPQDIALLDARKGLKMFEKVGIPILGIVENMSTHICSNCGHEEHIFGAGGGAVMASDYNVDLLGSLPLDINIRMQADSGQPTVVAAPDSVIAQSYKEIARKAASKIAIASLDHSAKFPNIVIQKT